MQTFLNGAFLFCLISAGISSAKAVDDPKQRAGWIVACVIAGAGAFYFSTFLV